MDGVDDNPHGTARDARLENAVGSRVVEKCLLSSTLTLFVNYPKFNHAFFPAVGLLRTQPAKKDVCDPYRARVSNATLATGLRKV